MNLTDPTGHKAVEDSMIPERLSVHVNLVHYGTKSQYLVSNDGQDGHLCGHVSFAMIYETITHRDINPGDIADWGYKNKIPEFAGTDAKDIGDICKDYLPGWKVVGLDGRYGYKDHTNNLQLEMPEGTDMYHKKIREMLKQGYYVMAGVLQDPDPGGTNRLDPIGVEHWVVVTGMIGDDIDGYVFVNNPFTNECQTYTATEFWASFNNGLVGISPDENYVPPIQIPRNKAKDT